jgi:hypothetical protein
MQKNCFECLFCKKSFSAKSSLTLHQKTAKYCLKIRGEQSMGGYSCECCGRTFTNQHRLTSHHNTCKERQEKNSIECLQRQIKILTKQLKEEQILNKTLKKEIELIKKGR